MNHRLVYLVAGLALAGGSLVLSANAATVSGTVDILVSDTPQRQYAHDGRSYVEARRGREYAIRIRNPYGVRVAVALSVDGLNTIDAKETTAWRARKWVLAPYETVTINGWQTSHTEARRFEFTTEDRSYGRVLGSTANLGVISAVFFKERLRVPSAAAPVPDAPATHDRKTLESRARQESADAPAASGSRADDYAATGMGRPTDHVVRQVWLDLEQTPAQSIDIRYEFRAQLVRLGILPSPDDRLRRRERTHGFTPEFCPVP